VCVCVLVLPPTPPFPTDGYYQEHCRQCVRDMCAIRRDGQAPEMAVCKAPRKPIKVPTLMKPRGALSMVTWLRRECRLQAHKNESNGRPARPTQKPCSAMTCVASGSTARAGIVSVPPAPYAYPLRFPPMRTMGSPRHPSQTHPQTSTCTCDTHMGPTPG
jgi:hypothetical protein